MRVVAGLLACALLALALVASRSERLSMLSGTWSFTEAVHVDRGTYFRLKVDVSYRGEPQHFSIVVGCNVLDILYKDNSSTHEVGLVPTVYGRRMRDGRGLVVRVPDACGGETTANGDVPANFMPVMVVYDDADTLGFGRAYMADEAYDSPNSAMRFGKASVEKATRAEFEAFRKSGPPNLVTRDQYHSAQPDDQVAKLGLKKIYPGFARHCWAYTRSLIPEALRPAVRRFWPADRPRFWLTSFEHLNQLGEVFPYYEPSKLPRDDGRLEGEMAMSVPDEGAYRRDGVKGVSTMPFIQYAPSIYPASSDVSMDRFPRDPAQWEAHIAELKSVSIMDVDVAGTANRGFAYCYVGDPLELPRDKAAFDLLRRPPAMLTVAGTPAAGAPAHWSGLLSSIAVIFEDDRFIFNFSHFYLESTRGDV